MELIDILKDFMLTEAVSGYEKKMAYKMKGYLETFTDQVEIDKAGNVISTFPGTDPSSPSIMIFAHLDQLGFIVRKIEASGLIQIDRLGGIPEKVLPATKVSVATIDGEYVPAVIGNKAHHTTSADEKYKVDLVTSLFVDIGASSRQEVIDRGIHVGCPVCYTPSFTRLLGTMVSGPSVDNRGGCSALVKLAEHFASHPRKSTVHIVGSVWEEFSIRGAIFAARKLRPDLAIALDVALNGDTPDLSNRYESALSKGPTVTLYNFHGRGTLNGTIAHNGLYRHMLSCAEEEGLPLQEFSSIGMLTDCAYVQLEADYIGCLDMGFPARYTHSPAEVCDVHDIEQLVQLLSYAVGKLDSTFNCKRY